MSYFVFSDIDGTLLDHNNYSLGNLEGYINEIKNKVSIIFNTSKTFSEVIKINEKLKLDSPFIVENGACIFFPTNYENILNNYKLKENFFTHKNYFAFKMTYLTAENLPLMISRLKSIFNFSFYSELTNKEVMKFTNLKIDSVRRSKERLFTNPILWKDLKEKIIDFKSEIKKIDTNLNVLEGGRFIHISDNYNKGKALKKFLEILTPSLKTDFKTISLGDSENDLSMLESTDYSCIVKREKNKMFLKKKNNVYLSQSKAPEGWKESLDFVLKMEN